MSNDTTQPIPLPPLTPELDRLRVIERDILAVRLFLESAPYVLAEWTGDPADPGLKPSEDEIHEVLAKHFDIDWLTIEAERAALQKYMGESL